MAPPCMRLGWLGGLVVVHGRVGNATLCETRPLVGVHSHVVCAIVASVCGKRECCVVCGRGEPVGSSLAAVGQCAGVVT